MKESDVIQSLREQCFENLSGFRLFRVDALFQIPFSRESGVDLYPGVVSGFTELRSNYWSGSLVSLPS